MKTGRTNKSLIIMGCLVAFVAMGVAKGSYASEFKIGYVDLRIALNESEPGKKAKAELESTIKIRQAAVEEKGKAIEKLKSDLEKQGSVLSAEARKTKEEEVERMIKDYQRLVQDSQADVKKREEKLTVSIVKELRDIIDKIGREENYSLILENAESIILYSQKNVDITEQVIKRYNESKATPKAENK
jgi:outer membrane protein